MGSVLDVSYFTLPWCISITSAIPDLFISKHFGPFERTWSPVFSNQCVKGSRAVASPRGDWSCRFVKGVQNCWRRDSLSKALETGSQQKASAALTDFWRAFLKSERISGCPSEETLGGQKWLGTDAARPRELRVTQASHIDCFHSALAWKSSYRPERTPRRN